jgi:hypothetical protein
LLAGVGNVTRRSVPPAAAALVAVRKLASGLSGSSWIAEIVPVRFVLAAMVSGSSCSNDADARELGARMARIVSSAVTRVTRGRLGGDGKCSCVALKA